MYNPTEQFAAMDKANVDNAIKLASLSIEKAEKLVALNLNAAKLALAQGVQGAQAAASVKDVQELFALRTKIAELGVQSALGYSRTLYELSSETQSEFSALAEQAWSAYTKGVGDHGRARQRIRPAGSDVAERVPLDDCGLDGGVRPVPEGHAPGRQPGRRELPRRRRQPRRPRAARLRKVPPCVRKPAGASRRAPAPAAGLKPRRAAALGGGVSSVSISSS